MRNGGVPLCYYQPKYPRSSRVTDKNRREKQKRSDHHLVVDVGEFDYDGGRFTLLGYFFFLFNRGA